MSVVTQRIETAEDALHALLESDDPDEVEAILGTPLFDDCAWERVETSGYGVTKNQANDPFAALAELIANSYDAIVLKRVREAYGDATDAPYESLDEAAQDLIDQDNPEDLVELRADGPRGHGVDEDTLNLTLIDSGCGQTNDKFKSTFLNRLNSSKDPYPFLHGEYGMGSSAVYRFAGGDSYKLIASASHQEPDEWTWTLIRDNVDEARFEYLTLDGDIPTVSGEVDGRSHGTMVRMWDYHTNGVRKARIDERARFKWELERWLVDPPLPVRLNDSERDRSHYVHGLKPMLEKYNHLLDERFTRTVEFESDELGERQMDVYVFKDDAEIEQMVENGNASEYNKKPFVAGSRRDKRFLYTVNGQTHGYERDYFIKNACNLPKVGDDAIIVLDFEAPGKGTLSNIFDPSRDSVAEGTKLGGELVDTVKQTVSNDETLSAVEEARQSKLVSEQTDENFADIVDDWTDRDTEFIEYLQSGSMSTSNRGRKKNSETRSTLTSVELNEVPTMLNHISRFDGVSGDHEFYGENTVPEIEVPVDSQSHQRFILDAENGYFAENAPEITPTQARKSTALNDGLFTLTVEPIPSADAGDEHPITVEVPRDGQKPLQQTFTVRYTEAMDETNTPDTPDPSIDPPTYDLVDGEQKGWDDGKVLEIASYGDSVGDLHLLINQTAAPYTRFIENYTLTREGKEFVLRKYVGNIVAQTASAYVKFDTVVGEDAVRDGHTPPSQLAEQAVNGIGQGLLASVISPLELDKIQA